MGDLLEVSASRGRLWFWTAYTRTLIALGWRTPVAFLCAYAFSTWMATGAFPMIRSLVRKHFRDAYHNAPRVIFHVSPWHAPLGICLTSLWFILPFVLVRFGLRDRLAQLSCAIFLLTIPYITLLPAGVNFAGLFAIILVAAALSLRAWRRHMIVLAASIAPIAIATSLSLKIVLSPKIWYLFLPSGYTLSGPQLQRALHLYRGLELCIAAVVCSYLYRRLLQSKRGAFTS